MIFYPMIGKIVNKFHQTNAITKYKQEVEIMKDEDIENQKEIYNKYNKELLEDKVSNIDLLEKGKMIGYISIEKIKVFLPIYEGTSEKTLLKGIGHLENTSLPSTAVAYHAVFVGHTGITAKKFFDDLSNLSVGDEFFVTILNDNFYYRVCDINRVLPSETQNLKIKDDKQLVTLVTCIPKFVNSHRLLVTGEKMEG